MSKKYKITQSTNRQLIGAIFEYAILNDMKPPKWFSEFEKRNAARFDRLEKRIDNLVKVNNLKE